MENELSRETKIDGYDLHVALERVNPKLVESGQCPAPFWVGIDLFWLEADGDFDEAGLYDAYFDTYEEALLVYMHPDETMLRRRIAETLDN